MASGAIGAAVADGCDEPGSAEAVASGLVKADDSDVPDCGAELSGELLVVVVAGELAVCADDELDNVGAEDAVVRRDGDPDPLTTAINTTTAATDATTATATIPRRFTPRSRVAT